MATKELNTSKKVKIGIIGTGWIAETHVNVYKQMEDVEIVALADPVPGKAEKFAEVIEGAKTLGEKAKSLGMTLAYHNHDFEFEKIDGEYALDILYKEVPADILEPELDTCWVNVGGEDPAKYMLKYAGRQRLLHLKDFAGSKSENMYALIGIDEDKKKDGGGKFEFRPLGKGVQNFTAILDSAEKCGVEWVIVEQDNPSMGLSPLECAKVSIDYLKSL